MLGLALLSTSAIAVSTFSPSAGEGTGVFRAGDLDRPVLVTLDDACAAVEARQPGLGEVLRMLAQLNPEGFSTGSPLADINGDGMIDFQDWLDYMNCFTAGLPCADLNGDGMVDFTDWLLFINA